MKSSSKAFTAILGATALTLFLVPASNVRVWRSRPAGSDSHQLES